MFVDGTPEEWRQITNVNVIALCLCSKLTVNSLKERGLDDGHIINISSICGHQVLVGSSHFYTGTKFAVRALSEGLRQELQAANSGIKLSLQKLMLMWYTVVMGIVARQEKSNKMEKWVGRVAMVTGASSGIGAAICEDLVKHGMKVVGAARRIEKMQNEKGTFLPVQCDVTKDEDTYALFDKIKETFGGVDVCVNNAGMVGCGLDLLNGKPEEWRQISNVNVIALCLCSKLTVNSLKERGLDDGHIINISSIAAHQVLPLDISFTRTNLLFEPFRGLRQELQAANSGIKLSVVSPGLVKTEFVNQMTETPEFAKQVFESNTSLKSEDIAHSVSQILSAPPYMEVLDMIVAPRGVLKLDLK
ncbi:Granaticin polyketide synthase putative ketoacyl reductase 2 [Armadillidium vulgare]|nr:Granaticin polyketide synthase putative ketoacyl reductase 2 [Armadillidium vulgare]